MRPTRSTLVLHALAVTLAVVAGSADAEAKSRKAANGPAVVFSAIPLAIAKAARSTFGLEEKRRTHKRTRGPRADPKPASTSAAVPLPATLPLAKDDGSSDPATTQNLPAGNEAPVPSPRPVLATDAAEPEAGQESPAALALAALVVPDKVPIPTQSPLAPSDASVPPPGAALPPTAVALPFAPVNPPARPQRYQPDPRSQTVALTTMPAEETACRAKLRSLGVTFENRPAEKSEDGCSLPYPVSVRSLGGNVKLEPAALMDCAMAETMAGFTGSVIEPTLKQAYGHSLRSISQASAYVCRPRHGTMKLSEHAFGNALDVARFTLDDGTAIDVKPDPDEKAAKVLASLRHAACGPFKTVLGPGSDADHALHLHFDLAPRRNGSAYCH